MNRLSSIFKKNLSINRKSLVAYLVAGDPSIEESLELLHGFVSAGVDIIEIGIPFSDPIAEGPIIQSAHHRALSRKVTFDSIIRTIKLFRHEDQLTPIILMGYLNTFLMNESYFEDYHKIGVDGVLIVDAPGEFSLTDLGFKSNSTTSISLISPTTEKKRIQRICDQSSGFLYYVTLRGVTGSDNLDLKEIQNNIQNIKSYTQLPVMAGFGIKDKNDAYKISQAADGIVVGSALVRMINEESSTKNYKIIYNYLSDLVTAINP